MHARVAILRDSFEVRLKEISGLDLLLGSLATKIAFSLLVVGIGSSSGLKSQALLQNLLNERRV